jgi:hypothetical protein
MHLPLLFYRFLSIHQRHPWLLFFPHFNLFHQLLFQFRPETGLVNSSKLWYEVQMKWYSKEWLFPSQSIISLTSGDWTSLDKDQRDYESKSTHGAFTTHTKVEKSKNTESKYSEFYFALFFTEILFF